MICCCCLWLVLLGTGNRSARIIEISRFFIFLYFIRLEKTFGFDFSGGGKEGRQEEENKVKSKTAGVLDHDNSIQRKREKRTREREIMPHWWTPCLEAYPIRSSSYPDSSFYETLSSSSFLFCRDILFCVVFFPCLSSLLRLLSHSFLSLSLIFAAEGSKQGSFVLLHLRDFQHLQMSRVLQTDCLGFYVFSL